MMNTRRSLTSAEELIRMYAIIARNPKTKDYQYIIPMHRRPMRVIKEEILAGWIALRIQWDAEEVEKALRRIDNSLNEV